MVADEGGIIMYPEVDFLYLNEQEMIKAGVKKALRIRQHCC